MVCGDWILSEYNTGGFVFGEFEDIVNECLDVSNKSDGNYVASFDIIENNKQYYLVTILC